MTSKTRTREADKIHTPAQMYARLTPLQRKTLDVMGESEPVGVPYHAIQALIDWGLVTTRRSGWVLTLWGTQTRDYGRAQT